MGFKLEGFLTEEDLLESGKYHLLCVTSGINMTDRVLTVLVTKDKVDFPQLNYFVSNGKLSKELLMELFNLNFDFEIKSYVMSTIDHETTRAILKKALKTRSG